MTSYIAASSRRRVDAGPVRAADRAGWPPDVAVDSRLRQRGLGRLAVASCRGSERRTDPGMRHRARRPSWPASSGPTTDAPCDLLPDHEQEASVPRPLRKRQCALVLCGCDLHEGSMVGPGRRVSRTARPAGAPYSWHDHVEPDGERVAENELDACLQTGCTTQSDYDMCI